MKSKYYLITSLMLVATVFAEELPVEQLSNTEETENQLHAYLASERTEEPTEESSLEAIANYNPYRLISNKDPQGWNVELDDGAIWRAVDSSSASEMKYWKTNDPVVIHPTAFPNWAGGRFFLLNERLNTTAVVELSQGPVLNRSTNAQITYIDYSSGYLEIQDGIGRSSYFHIDYSDSLIFKSWRPGQSIIVGSNEDCYAGWLSNYSYILINVEKNEFVRANLN
jgi:hypothetical protein